MSTIHTLLFFKACDLSKSETFDLFNLHQIICEKLFTIRIVLNSVCIVLFPFKHFNCIVNFHLHFINVFEFVFHTFYLYQCELILIKMRVENKYLSSGDQSQFLRQINFSVLYMYFLQYEPVHINMRAIAVSVRYHRYSSV